MSNNFKSDPQSISDLRAILEKTLEVLRAVNRNAVFVGMSNGIAMVRSSIKEIEGILINTK